MKSKISPTAIGMFIAGAIVIIFASVILFGSGKLFRHTKSYLMTFREPAANLDLGAPVKLMGVQIGQVKDVSVILGGTNDSLMINVVVEVDTQHLKQVARGFSMDLDDRKAFDRAVNEKGLCGRLDMLSFLSGQLYVSIDVYPGAQGFQLGEESSHGYWEIPTLPSSQREMMQSLITSLNHLAELDFNGLSIQLNGLMRELRAELAQLNLGEVNTNLLAVLTDTRKLVGNPMLLTTITNLDLTLVQLNELTSSLNQNVTPLLTNADTDLKKAGMALDEATATLRALRAQVQPGSALTRELINTLNQAEESLNALQQLAQELQRNPSALITGKQESQP